MLKSIDERLNEKQPIDRAVLNTRLSHKKFVTRLKRRIELMLLSPFCYFVTFTISSEFYDIKKETIIRKVKEALGGASHWIFNEDYGSENARLHFHAVVSYHNQLDYNTILAIYQYGAVNFRLVQDKNEKALREYLTKLVNHSIKGSAFKLYRSRSAFA